MPTTKESVMSEHAREHPDDGEYWKKNFNPNHSNINACYQFRECFTNNRRIPEFLWKQVAQFFGFDPNNQPEQLKPNAPFAPEDLAKLNQRIAELEKMAKENGTIKEPERQMRQPASVPGTV